MIDNTDYENSSVGALEPQPNAMERAPAIAEPTTHGGMILSGSDAANGIAPSVIKESPIM